MTGYGAPDLRELTATVPAAGAAVVQDQVVGDAPFGGVVSSVSVVSEAAVVANASNYRTIRIINKGQAGTGNTVVASLALDTPGTDNLVAFDDKDIPVSGVAGATTVADGDVLAVDETVTGTGLAHSGYEVIVRISRVTG